jgi:hypothetical protein
MFIAFIRCQWFRAVPSGRAVWGPPLTGIAGSYPAGLSVSRGCCVLSSRGLYDGPITHTEESYQLWCVILCDLKTSRMRRPWPELDSWTGGKGEWLEIGCGQRFDSRQTRCAFLLPSPRPRLSVSVSLVSIAIGTWSWPLTPVWCLYQGYVEERIHFVRACLAW